MTGRLRLISGYVLFTYATMHLLNHMLGILSVDAMEAGLPIFVTIWRNPLGTIVLGSALVVHVSLVLWSLFQRRRLRMSRAEWLQLVLGFLIVPLGAVHFIGTRMSHDLYDVQVTYTFVLLATLASGWDGVARQLGLVLVVWIHGCIGLHRAWRLKAWYAPVRGWLLGLAVAWPALALAGSVAAFRDIAAAQNQPDWLDRTIAAIRPPTQAQLASIYDSVDATKLGMLALVLLVLAARPLRDLWHRRSGVVRVTYGGQAGGPRAVTAPVGLSVLEISRSYGIPHASVCGGRGRCSTCRVRLGDSDRDRLPGPSDAERKVLERVDAPDGVRLACQLRPPAGDYHVTPLLPPAVATSEAYRPVSGAHGRERTIVVLFCDLRGFTRMSEGRLPYDVVFILNRYFRAVGEAIVGAGGHIDKFIGDGAMALFGAEPGPGTGGEPRDAARRSLDAARRIAIAIDDLNRSLSGDLERPLRVGIGLHAGPAIVGEMGYGRTVGLTAIGDTVNTASRLESASKELACELVVSAELLAVAGLTLDEHPEHLLEIRGRHGRMQVRAVHDAAKLELAAS